MPFSSAYCWQFETAYEPLCLTTESSSHSQLGFRKAQFFFPRTINHHWGVNSLLCLVQRIQRLFPLSDKGNNQIIYLSASRYFWINSLNRGNFWRIVSRSAALGLRRSDQSTCDCTRNSHPTKVSIAQWRKQTIKCRSHSNASVTSVFQDGLNCIKLRNIFSSFKAGVNLLCNCMVFLAL